MALLTQAWPHPLTPHLLVLCSVDGHPLNIKQLLGKEPVEVIDLSGKKLTAASAIIIASLITSNTATKSLKCAQPAHLCLKRHWGQRRFCTRVLALVRA